MAERPDIFTLDDVSDERIAQIDQAKAAVKADNASSLSAVRKLIALASGHPTPLFTIAELRGLDLAYPHMNPAEARSTVQSYASRAYAEGVAQMRALAEYESAEPALMHANVEGSLQKTIAHALVHFEDADHDDATQSDTDPTAAATMSANVPTVGGFNQKPVDPEAAYDAIDAAAPDVAKSTDPDDTRALHVDADRDASPAAPTAANELSPGDERLP